MIFIALSAVLIVLSLYTAWCWKIHRILSGLKSLNGPRSLPFVGCLLSYLPPSEGLKINRAFFGKYGKTYKAALGLKAGIITMEPEFINFILGSKVALSKSDLYKMFKHLFGSDGMFLSGYSKWRKLKKFPGLTFHQNMIKLAFPVFRRNSEILVEQLAKAAEKNNGDINIYHYVSLAAMDNIIETCTGASISTQMNQNSDYVSATGFISHQLVEYLLNPTTYISAIYMCTANYWKERKAVKQFREFTMKLIQLRKEHLLQSASSPTDYTQDGDDDVATKKHTSYLDILLDARLDGEPFRDYYILNEIASYLFGGYDTATSAITFTLFCIAENPIVQAKIIDEQKCIFGSDPEREATMDDLKQMTYLEMVIKEGLRLYTPVPFIARVVDEDVQYGDLRIARRTQIIIAINDVHHDPDLYPEPEEFRPERFHPEEHTKRHPGAYLPFSGGPRNCMGQRYAMTEVKMTLSQVCRNFEFTTTNPPHKCKIIPSIVILSENGVHVNIKRRQWQSSTTEINANCS